MNQKYHVASVENCLKTWTKAITSWKTITLKDPVSIATFAANCFAQKVRTKHEIHPPNGVQTNIVNDKTTQEEPYSCEVCSKVFKYSADNMIHQVEIHGHFGITDELKDSKQPVQPYLVHLLSEQTMLLYEEIDELKGEAKEQNKIMTEEISTLKNQIKNLLNIYQECRKRWKIRKNVKSEPSESNKVGPLKKKTSKEKKESKSNIEYKCTFCEVITATLNEIKTHEKDVHSPSSIQFKCRFCEVITTTSSEMKAHERDIHRPSIIQFKCRFCEVRTATSSEMRTHETNVHSPPATAKALNKVGTTTKNTLLIGDSHIRTMNLKAIEKATGGNLYTPGYLGGRRGRAYCSTSDWPEAMFPASNLTERVPQLLAGKERAHMVAGHGRVSGAAPQERVYNNLIIQASCNDISNLGEIGDQETQYTMAEQSSRNTLTVMEKALSVFPSLEKGVILLRPPRADVLYDLSEHANFSLRGMVEKSNLKSRITIASMEELHFDTQEKMIQVFGPNTSSRSYGIHMDGEQGKELFTRAIVSGIRSAGLNRRGQGVRRKQEKEQEVSPNDVWRTIKGGKKTSPIQDRPSVITTNMFTGLN